MKVLKFSGMDMPCIKTLLTGIPEDCFIKINNTVLHQSVKPSEVRKSKYVNTCSTNTQPKNIAAESGDNAMRNIEDIKSSEICLDINQFITENKMLAGPNGFDVNMKSAKCKYLYMLNIIY